MPAGSHGKTSTIFYHRGVPNRARDFGGLAAGNYSIVQPTRIVYEPILFSRMMSKFISVSRSY